MPTVSPSTFGLHDDVPEVDLDPTWRAFISQQAHTLATMLQHIQTAVAGAPRHTDTRRLQVLAADAERLLTAQAQQLVSLKRERGPLRALVADPRDAPVELTGRVQRLERVIAVLHANLAVARRTLALLTQAQG